MIVAARREFTVPTMDRRRRSLFVAVWLINIILTISSCDLVLSLPPPISSGRALRSSRSVPLSSDPHQRSLRQLDNFSYLTDHHGNNHGGGGGRPVFGALNLRSMDQSPPDSHNYWDFVLGSEPFKRRGAEDLATEKSTSGHGPMSRFDVSAGTLVPRFDVLGRRVVGEGKPNEASKETDRSLNEVKKRSDNNKSVRSFFPATSDDENHDFFNFLLGEDRR